MTTETQKTELLEEFQSYLQQPHQEFFTAQEQPDLNTLLSELTSLKTEVKMESRQFKSTIDTLSTALDSAHDSNHYLTTEIEENTKRFKQEQDKVMRSMLLEMVDIYDRLSTSIAALQNYQPVNLLFRHSHKKDIHFIERFKEGQIMSLKRFEQLLQRHQVKIINCTGQLLDPVTMTAVETGEAPELANGIVLEELRKGFLYQEQVLRLAEVKVNKITHK